MHYHKLSEIVKETSEEFGHPYKSKRRLRDAVASHFKVLKALGKKDASPVLEAVFVP